MCNAQRPALLLAQGMRTTRSEAAARRLRTAPHDARDPALGRGLPGVRAEQARSALFEGAARSVATGEGSAEPSAFSRTVCAERLKEGCRGQA